MNFRKLLMTATVVSVVCFANGVYGQSSDPALDNPQIDMDAHLQMVKEAAEHREERRLSEEDFIKMSQEPDTIILDARSQSRYNELHIKGAINLSFPDMTIESLQALIPDKNTRILIYCNNNFMNAEIPFPSKLAPAALNLSTYTTLFIYGYRNIFELAPVVDPAESILEFESSLMSHEE